ncbi:MAG: phosphomannomutase [Desulfobacteraceae bacterium 4572_130]|nr:MAG: phosphomannomutase [Desulfobacteraceae bacterium 4572_130]
MNFEIFREYDIRGIAGKDMTEEDVINIGKAYGTLLQPHNNKKVIVGRDCRKTSDFYSELFIKGVISTGYNVIDIGICPTPVLYFSIYHLNKTNGGVMVTASHNPPEHNGFKLMKGFESIHSQGLQELRQIIEKKDYATSKNKGKVEQVDVITSYIKYIQENISISKKIKIGVDAGNGTGGITALPVLKALGCEIHDIYCDMDGNFPNHSPDPSAEKNMTSLIKLVKEKNLDLGVGYDGDADRIGIIDENGNFIYNDRLVIIFAREILSRKPGSTFISEVKCSKVMYDDIEKHGGRAIMWRTGHSLIKKKMKQENAELAGEMSGHMFFKDRYLGFDDALYATCRLLEIIASTGKSVSELISDLPETYVTPEIRANCADNKKFKVVEKITKHFKKIYNVIDIDGMRVLYDDGWGLVRASNTQPCLVLRFEALTQNRLDQIKDEIKTVLEKIIGEI